MFSDKDKHLIQFYSKTRHLGACCIIKLFPEKKDLGIMQDRVYARKITSIDRTQQHISDEWDKIDQQLIYSAIKKWRKHLAACVSAEVQIDPNCS